MLIQFIRDFPPKRAGDYDTVDPRRAARLMALGVAVAAHQARDSAKAEIDKMMRGPTVQK